GLDDHRGLHGLNDTPRTSQEAVIRQVWRFFCRVPAADGAGGYASALGPHQPGKYSASSLFARRSARSMARAKSASTVFLLILRRKKSAHRNSLNGAVSLEKPPARRSSPARLRYGSSLSFITVFGMSE